MADTVPLWEEGGREEKTSCMQISPTAEVNVNARTGQIEQHWGNSAVLFIDPGIRGNILDGRKGRFR